MENEVTNKWAEMIALAESPETLEGLPPEPDEYLAVVSDEEPKRSRLMGIGYLKRREPVEALIDQYMPRIGLGSIYGPSYTGKSFVAVSLALSVCAGLSEWMGKPLNINGPQTVIYVGAEGGQTLWDQIEGWLAAHKDADLSGLRVLDSAEGHTLNVVYKAEDGSWNTSLDRLKEEIKAACPDGPPAMVVIDPQINVIPTVEENSNKEMMQVLGQLKHWADTWKTLVVLIHHTGHEGGRARGASAQKATMDLQVEVNGSDGKGEIWFQKVKGAAKPKDALTFKLDAVEIEGGSQWSAVAVPDVRTNVDKHESWDRQITGAITAGHTSASAIAKYLEGNRKTVTDQLTRMESDGKIVDQGKGNNSKWSVVA